ncbi:hypothetical protein SSX86_003933 [Deinandra increscens subsp. villosa]|uniref:Uncharacterized protein n=1 Tax=Deinandra increscens subsp. villosa TaxID=3103831 RepID=A0AAP0DMR1_9ASTR
MDTRSSTRPISRDSLLNIPDSFSIPVIPIYSPTGFEVPPKVTSNIVSTEVTVDNVTTFVSGPSIEILNDNDDINPVNIPTKRSKKFTTGEIVSVDANVCHESVDVTMKSCIDKHQGETSGTKANQPVKNKRKKSMSSRSKVKRVSKKPDKACIDEPVPKPNTKSRGENTPKNTPEDPNKEKKIWGIRTRSSTAQFHRCIQILRHHQKQVVRNMGFGQLLTFMVNGLPAKLAYYVVDNFDPKLIVIKVGNRTIKVDRDSIKILLGVPSSGIKFQPGNELKQRDPKVLKWRRRYSTSFISPTQLVDKIRDSLDEDSFNFRMDFIMCFLSVMVECYAQGSLKEIVLDYISSDVDFKHVDWVYYIIEAIKRCKERWRREDNRSEFAGPLAILMLLYVDSTKCNGMVVDDSVNAITFWTKQNLKFRQELKIQNGCFGKVKLKRLSKVVNDGSQLFLDVDLDVMSSEFHKKLDLIVKEKSYVEESLISLMNNFHESDEVKALVQRYESIMKFSPNWKSHEVHNQDDAGVGEHVPESSHQNKGSHSSLENHVDDSSQSNRSSEHDHSSDEEVHSFQDYEANNEEEDVQTKSPSPNHQNLSANHNQCDNQAPVISNEVENQISDDCHVPSAETDHIISNILGEIHVSVHLDQSPNKQPHENAIPSDQISGIQEAITSPVAKEMISSDPPNDPTIEIHHNPSPKSHGQVVVDNHTSSIPVTPHTLHVSNDDLQVQKEIPVVENTTTASLISVNEGPNCDLCLSQTQDKPYGPTDKNCKFSIFMERFHYTCNIFTYMKPDSDPLLKIVDHDDYFEKDTASIMKYIFTRFLESVHHTKSNQIASSPIHRMKLFWATLLFLNDNVVFLMRHMEKFFGRHLAFNCEFDNNGSRKKAQLKTLRNKYAAAILLSCINNMAPKIKKLLA